VKTIALISRKGGCGKTTLAVHLAVCAVRAGKAVALIDLDPQGSSFDWFEVRESQDELAATRASEQQLPELLKQAEIGGVDLCIIDTAPHSDSAAATAAKLADFVLVPCRPARFDMKAIPSTMAIVQLTKTPAALVVNVAPPVGKLAEEAKEALELQGYPVLESVVSGRVAFNYAVTDGRSVHEYEPNGKAAQEISELYQEIMSVI
jgi:chromosome partitioning protein